jgi:predicted Rossmann fold flavoprotein
MNSSKSIHDTPTANTAPVEADTHSANAIPSARPAPSAVATPSAAESAGWHRVNIDVDIAIVGGGAAGLATAVFAGRLLPGRRIAVLDGAAKLGAKILVSGGGRCNVTNRAVTVNDFNGGSRNVIKRVLAALPVDQTISFFREIGVEVYEEKENGKLFPTTDSARTVLEALLAEAERTGARLLPLHRVTGILSPSQDNDDRRFRITTGTTTLVAHNVVLATGGQSLPKTGSDGAGYQLAESLGHTLIPLTPALDPLLLAGEYHKPLSGISHTVELIVRAQGCKPVIVHGIMLWTHFGISGPAVLDISRHWHRAKIEGREVAFSVNLLPGMNSQAADERLLDMVSTQPKAQVHNAMSRMMPARVADVFLGSVGIAGTTVLAHLTKEARRRVAQSLVNWTLPVCGGRGYTFAEATAGGVPLSEVEPSTLESRKCPGLYLVGEILDVDGRIGGFNFQWAWSSAKVVSTALHRRLAGTG